MARINLLPWRENLRRERQRNFMIALAATAVVAILLVFAGSHLVEREISGQDGRNQYLQNEIRALDRQIATIEKLEAKRDDLLQRKEVIERLQENRSMMVHLFNSLAQTVPEGIRLNSVGQSGERLTISGTAQSETRVSDYMRNIERAEWMHDPELSIIEAIEGAASKSGFEPYRFELRARIASPKTVEQEEAAAKALEEEA